MPTSTESIVVGHLEIAVKRMDGLALLRVDIRHPMLDTVFTFEQDVVLRLFAEYSSEMEHWMLVVPDGNVLTLGPGTMWSYHLGSEMRPLGYVAPTDPAEPAKNE